VKDTEMPLEYLLESAVALALAGYLLYALLRPERF
jgi:K+-transporting ATPase KdpF subunit